MRNGLKTLQKNVSKSGKNLQEFLKSQNWSQKQIQSFVNEVQSFANDTLPVWQEAGLVDEGIAKDILLYLEMLGLL
jgi:hypothetical protein